MLYTGDGYLNSPPKLQRVCDYLSASRVGRIATLQVMHHGSRNNWHSGVAAQVDPLLSVFSSNPGHRKMRHPHLEVLRDFWMYGPVQVCQGQDAVIHAWAF